MSDWVNAKVIKIKKWSKNLFSIFLNAKVKPFIAGQFAKLSVINNNKRIQRAYSYVNSPKNSTLEFYIVSIKNGIMSTILNKLKKNDKILISKESYGFLTIKDIPKKDNLYMIATGTGIGPYLSILSEKKNIKKFKKIILIYGVRYYKDLSYLKLINYFKKKYKKKLKIKITLSQEKKKKFLHGRITELFKNKIIGKKIKKKNTQIMLCGNPNMIKEMCNILKKKNMFLNLRSKPGNITIENYW